MKKKVLKRSGSSVATQTEFEAEHGVVCVTIKTLMPTCEWRMLGEYAAEVRQRVGSEAHGYDEFSALRSADRSDLGRRLMLRPVEPGCECISCRAKRQKAGG